MKTKTRNDEKPMETGLREILSGRAGAMKIDAKDFDVSVFSEIRYGEKEGIGVYYLIYRDGSCAEAQYFKFRIHGDGAVVERANKREMQEYDKERLGHLLRR
ncbi:MAG: hypothetical protein AMDU2_EPLC00007G0084 [Thermoplasmatales archaeon E-plasma]|nr:MAG: hypothetical protein AMDU2_EPLC00007G0084 [Thermoplasmatales archaeon E-plasma]